MMTVVGIRLAYVLACVVTFSRGSSIFLEQEDGNLGRRHSGKKHHVAISRNEDPVDGFVKGLRFKHRLRVCNAYPNSIAMDVYRAKEKLTGEEPMAYKSCREFRVHLASGDKLEFMVGGANAGTFSVSDLPNNDAVLFLVVLRHDTLSTAVSFESHVFANLLNAQVAIIDTFKGQVPSRPRILDSVGAGARSEQLRFNSVVAVNPGVYEVELDDPKDGKEEVQHKLVALNRESYVVLRTGLEAQEGPQYPQELVIFPQSDPAALRSGAQANLHSTACTTLLSFFVAVALLVL